MTREDIVRKLSSRKFWMAVVGVVVSVMQGLKADPETIESICSCIMSSGVLIAYILSEGFIDAKRIDTENHKIEE